MDKTDMERLGAIVANELTRAEGADEDELQANRATALDYYFGRPRGDEVVGKSAVQSMDVSDMVNAVLALLVPMLSTDAVVIFEPNGQEDEAQVQAESDVVNQTVMEENQGFIEIQEACKDALLLKNGAMKVWVDDTVDVLDIPTAGLEVEEVAVLMEPRAPNETRELSKSGKTVKVTTTTRLFRSAAVPIERISYQANYCGPLQDIRFFAEAVDYTRSDLVGMGIKPDVVNELSASATDATSAGRARDTTTEEGSDAQTRDQDAIDCHECYILVDLDGDGISERYWVLVAEGSKVLDYEPADLIPYSLGSPFLNPHRITGESLFDHLKSVQDVKTAFLRQWVDNATVNNNGRYAYDPGQTNEKDVLTPRAGGGIRSRNPAQSLVPIPINDVGPSIAAALQYQDKVRTERGGASLDMLSSDAQLVGETAHGIERQYASREAMVSMMAKNLSETLIRGVYVLMHEYLRRYCNEPKMVRLAGKWTPVDPRQWPKRVRVNVTTGMTPGARGHMQSTLSQTVQMQLSLIQSGAGGQLADLQTLYRTCIDWMRMAGVDNPESHWIDPASEQAQAAAQAAAEQAQAAQAQQAQLVQMQIQLEQMKIENDRRAKEAELGWKYYDTDVDAEIQTAKVGAQGVIDLEKQRMSNERPEPAAAKGGAAST